MKFLSLGGVVVMAHAGCMDTGEDLEEGAVVQELAVTWTNVVGVAATGNSLTKTATQNLWNAGATSTQTINGDGFVEFTTAETTSSKMAGLSNGNTNQHYNDIDFAIHLKSGGQISIREGGVLRSGSFGTYLPGDVFRVEADGGVVDYSKNGTSFYTSTLTPTFPLLVDTAILTPAGTINSVQIVSTSITWQNAAGVTTTENGLVKTIGQPWNAGASSVETISNAGYAEFSTDETTTAKMAGLGNGDASVHYSDIEYAIHLKVGGVVRVYEAGVLRNVTSSYVAGDFFRVQATGAVVTYQKNGVTFYTSAVAPVYPLRFDSSLLTKNATITDVVLQQQ